MKQIYQGENLKCTYFQGLLILFRNSVLRNCSFNAKIPCFVDFFLFTNAQKG